MMEEARSKFILIILSICFLSFIALKANANESGTTEVEAESTEVTSISAESSDVVVVSEDDDEEEETEDSDDSSFIEN